MPQRAAMNQDTYIRYLEAQGLRVFEAEGALWVNKRKFFYENVPPHRLVHLSPGAIERLFRRGAAAVRYTCAEEEGKKSFEYVCSDKNFSLLSLLPDARRRVRRGLEACEIRPVDFDLLAQYGCAINRSTFARQGRSGVDWMRDEALWSRYMKACSGLPGVYAYGAFVEGRFCGFSISVIVDDYAYLFHTQALSEYLKYSAANALTYAMTKTMLEKAEVRYVSQGLESFNPLPDLENFKLAMGFRKRALGRRVVVNRLARPLFSNPAVWLAGKILRRWRPNLAEDLATFASALNADHAKSQQEESAVIAEGVRS
jgi:hypothetical protein